ncbi:MAG: flagellar biosynthesis protein FlhB [Syntrophales bacterium]|nr:flagellar biosynthesis protein FlhB [Syntrophales bacterium]
MADQNKDQEKTEQATPKRREEARKKGQVAKSQEVASVVVLMSGLVFFYFASTGMVDGLMRLMRWLFSQSGQFDIDSGSIQLLASVVVTKVFYVFFPLFLVVLSVALVANYLQVGFVVSGAPITPKFSKISPIKGFQRLFSMRSFVDLMKNLLKISIIAFVVYITIKGELESIFPLMDQNAGGILLYIGRVSLKIIFRACLALIIIAVLDYAYQKWEFEKNLKMSKQEVKDENKQSEGDPLIKARVRRLQRAMARSRMMANVPKADVVITNPTHLAVALRYEQTKMSAPKVIAKGRGLVAEKIKEIAMANGITIVENKPLARVLYKAVGVEQVIPENLYRAVAEVLAYVYNLKAKKGHG